MVSVIIPTYNRAQYIKRAIESVLCQTYQDFELIIVDDNNPGTIEREELEKVMKEYLQHPKVKFIQHDKNKNGAVARNTAIKVARGDYITFLDDDDFYLRNRLQVLVEELEKHPEYSGAYTGGIILYKCIFDAKQSGNLQKEVLMQRSFFKTGSNMFFKANVVKELNGFNETFIRHQDLEFMVRFFRKNKILAVNQILVVKDNSSRMNELNIEKAIEMKEKYLKTFEEDINKYKDKNGIFFKNYVGLLIEAAKQKDKTYYKNLKEKVLQYGKMSSRLKAKLWIYQIFKNYVKIKRNIQKMIIKRKISRLDSNIVEELNLIINKGSEKEKTYEKSK